MPWDSCVITLNSDSTGSLYCGDIVTGFVQLEFKQFQKIENIEFLVYGRCKAHWTRPSPVTPYIRFYSQKKKLLYISIDLFENLKGKTVKPAVYEYPFHFALPQDLPSSFETYTGKVQYSIKVKSGRITTDLPFVVRSSVNLNHVERLLEPSYHEILKTFWNAAAGTVIISVKTYTGFSPKQTIPIEISIKNDKKVRIYNITITLIQKIHYTVLEGYKDEENKKCKVEQTKFLNSEKETYNLMMEIPHVVPSSIHTTDPMIGISYVLRVCTKFIYHSTVCEDIPVTVATVPLLHCDFDEF